MIIREMTPKDCSGVLEIYKQGIDSGKATFITLYPTWQQWDEGHHRICRYVAEIDNEIAGFVAVSPVSEKPHLCGVVEVTIYIDERYHHRGVGTRLLERLISDAPSFGFWCLYSSIFSTNEASIRLHQKCGFRTIGERERIAKDKFGHWMNTTLMEYRFPDEQA